MSKESADWMMAVPSVFLADPAVSYLSSFISDHHEIENYMQKGKKCNNYHYYG